jgi:hypothetical protein
MSFTPINGLQILAVESGLLFAFTVLAFLILRFARHSIARPRWLEFILAKPSRSVLLVILAALAGRAIVMPWLGIPQPHINDEYSYLLMGDTFSHFRLTNPTPAAWRHFETFHVNLTPTYHSKYPVSQGVALAIGEVVFHQPWVGIYLSTAILCGAICWTLQVFVSPGWALVGGLLAVFRLALFSYWMNSYWGGSLAALGGTLALGSVMRLFDDGRPQQSRKLLAVIFGFSLLLLGTSRPYEGLAFSLPLLAYFAYKLIAALSRREQILQSVFVPVLVIGVAGLFMIGYYNRRTTGDPLLMPYVLNERTYAELPLFFGQHFTPPASSRDPVFTKYYVVEAKEHQYNPGNSASELFGLQVLRWGNDWFFYIGPALSFPVLLGLLLTIKRRDLRVVLAASITTAAAVASCIFSQAHYFAPATITIYVFAVAGLDYLWQQRGKGERAFAVAVCLTVVVASLTRNTGSAAINATYEFPNTRQAVEQQLEDKPGKQLVLVSYDMERHYPGDELVHNGAEFSAEKILWARSKGADHDSDLCRAYPDRTFWNLTTNDESFSLTPSDLCQR